MKENVIVLSANRYQMTNRETGDVNEGVTVRYAITDNLKPFEENNLKGYKLGKASIPFDDFDKISIAPALYEADMDLDIASDGTVKVKAKDFVYIGDIETKVIMLPRDADKALKKG